MLYSNYEEHKADFKRRTISHILVSHLSCGMFILGIYQGYPNDNIHVHILLKIL